MGKPPILAAIAALIAFLGTVIVQDDPCTLVWAEDGGPAPQRFLYLLFPKSPEVSIFAASEDHAIAPLGRAMTGSIAELRSGPHVTAWHGDTEGRVAVDDLAYLPREGAANEEIGRWRETMASWEAYGTPDATIEDQDDLSVVTLSTRYRSGREERFVYQTDGATVEPLRWTSHAPGAEVLGILRRLFITALAACLGFAGSRWWSKRATADSLSEPRGMA